MITTQELSVWYVLPSIRRRIALRLKEKGTTQKRIAKLLGVTEAAVSQYLNSKRAGEIDFSSEDEERIMRAAESLLEERSCFRYELENLLDEMKRKGRLCSIHRQHEDVPACCHVCLQQGMTR